jgi:thymidylate kinase
MEEMINSKLILIEGPPGSGKSGTAQRLAQEISAAGKACQCFLEWSENHPITIGADLQFNQVMDSALAREADLQQQWQAFVKASRTQETVTLMESRFWQTSVMLLYAAGMPRAEVLAHNRCTNAIIQAFNPVLIYFVIDDMRTFTELVIEDKEREWQKSGYADTWAGQVFGALERQAWFTVRGLQGKAGYLAFMAEWQSVAEELYAQLPFTKIKVSNPYQNWPSAMGQIRTCLGLG